MDLDEKTFKRLFPKLAEELESSGSRVAVNSVRTDTQTAERAASSRKFFHYMPDVIDFLRRCETKNQAHEIISYLERRGEIEKAYAEKLRRQLDKKGVRSFGPKKEEDYYLKSSGERGKPRPRS